MTNTQKLLFALGSAIALPVATCLAQAEEPQIKTLTSPKDPTESAVLIGRVINDGLTIQLELEGAEAMWMQMGTPAQWSEHVPAKNERYHIEIKVTDNATKTRLRTPRLPSLRRTKPMERA